MGSLPSDQGSTACPSRTPSRYLRGRPTPDPESHAPMSSPARQDRRPEQAATTALLVVMLVLAASAAAGVDRAANRHCGATGASSAIQSVCTNLTEGIPHPSCGLLAPPSETLASVGSRSGSAVAIDLTHLAGSSMELERRRHDLPPPYMS